MRIFGLNAAEARIAAAVASGDKLDTAAMELGVSRETLRSQLKGAFAKTGCSRQSELAALVSRIKFSAWN
jgi:DNA-binding CsgD family transcriptional regulator